MKNLLLVFLLFLNPLIAFAKINECKTDVYFANGILTEDEDAKYNALKILKPAIIDLLGQESFTQKIGKVTYAYNETHGVASFLVPPLPRWNAYINYKGNIWAEAAIKYMNRHILIS